MDNPAAWHPDPIGRHEYRWWDGSQWTEHVADGGVAAVDSLDSAVPTQDTAETPAAAMDPDDGPAQTDAGTTDAAAAAETSSWSQPGGTEPMPSADPQTQPFQQPAAQQPTQPQQPYQQPAQQPYQQPYQAGPADQSGPWPAAGTQPAPTAQPSNGMAVAALIIGIISVLIAWIPFVGLLGGLGGALALVLGILGRGKVKKEGAPSQGAATSGIVLGIVALVLSIVATAAVFVLGQQFFGDTIGSYQECLEETGGDEEFCERQLEDDLFGRFGTSN